MQTRLIDMLKATALQPEDIQALLRLRASASPLDSSNLRIDLAPYTHVHWLNDLEKVTTPHNHWGTINFYIVCITVGGLAVC